VAVRSPSSTLPEGDPDLRHGARRRVARRVVLAAFTLVVLLGLFGMFGVREGHRSATSAGGFRVELTYPRITRPALAIPFAVRITGLADVDDDVVVKMRSSYLSMFDENGMSPEPADETDDGAWTTWVFDRPPGDVLEVSLDTRVEPGVQWGRDGAVVVQVGDDDARIDFRTWVAP
jgi:hypothetical protein